VAKWLNKVGQQFEKKTVICHFAMKWSMSARVKNLLIRKANKGLPMQVLGGELILDAPADSTNFVAANLPLLTSNFL